ncbi:MAG: substrate-binding domain-containing protein [Uliginosibacterium sp.]|nr:substrate-binding domain-containing protein [Uliginosibacterium sp.]
MRVIVAANDEMAMAAITVASARGIRVPEGLAVVGVDNLHTHVAGLGLTTVNTALDKQLSTGVEMFARPDGRPRCPPHQFRTVTARLSAEAVAACLSSGGQPLGRRSWLGGTGITVLDGLALSEADRPRLKRYMQLCLDALSSEAPRALERAVADIARECFGLGEL